MKIKSIIVPCFLLAGAIATIAGCAVMRVDVDVYKGPLANHEDVQTEQMSAMAIGAKPILIELRDQLELSKLTINKEPQSTDTGTLDKNGTKVLTDQSSQGIKREKWLKSLGQKYEMGYMQPDTLKDVGAIRVNALLYLYEDGCDSETAPFIQKGKNELEKYKTAWRRFTTIPDANAKESWENLEKYMKQDDAKKSEGIKNLMSAYKIYLKPTRDEAETKQGKIVDAHRYLVKDGIITSDEFDPIKIFDSYINNGTSTVNKSANAIFGALTNKKLVEEHARILFKEKTDEQKKLFVDRVTSIAQGFLDARKAFRELFRTTLEALVVFGDKNTPKKDDAIKFVTDLIQPTHFNALLHAVELHKDQMPAKVQVLYTALKKLFNDKPLQDLPEESLILCLRDNLEKDTAFTASALLEADDHFKSNPLFENTRTIYDNIGIENQINILAKRGKDVAQEKLELSTPKKREFGLVKVVYEIQRAEELAKRFDVIVKGSAAGLEGGRLNAGIDTLTKNYLEAAAAGKYKNQCSDDSVEAARSQLVDTLIHFSEKVLVIANNKKLLEKSSPKDLIQNVDTYTVVLQSIGNSILIQADELRHQGSYKKKMEGNRNQEGRAIALAFSEDSIKYLSDIVYDIKVRKDAAEKNMDEITSKLKRELSNYPNNKLKDAKELTVKDFETQTTKFITSIEEGLTEKKSAYAVLNDEKVKIKDTLDIFSEYNDKFIPSENKKDDNDTAVKGNIILALEKIRLDPIISSEVRRKVKTTVDYLNDLKIDPLKGTSTDILKAFNRVVSENMVSNEKKTNDADSEIKKIEKINTLVENGINEFAKAKRDADKYNAVSEAINDARNSILTKMGNTKDMPTSTAVHSLLLKTLQEKIVTKQSSTELTPNDKTNNDTMRLAIAVLAEMKPIEKVNIDAEGVNSSKDTFDQLIATLRARHLSAITQFGADDPLTKKFSDSIDMAYNYRSGMVYIRPPSAYLRSSTPATSLQSAPGLQWKNMLSEHATRNMPLYEEVRRLWPGIIKNDEVVGEIDKQFWQNINSVRVAGAGKTNYVIAKDDVGNWYVKRYSADTEDIIKSAKKLAMFNMGSQMNMNLVSRITSKDGILSGTQQSTQQTGTQQSNEANRSTLDRLFDKHKGLYGEKTNTAFGTLTKMLKPEFGDGENKMSEVENAILKSWSNSKDCIDANFLTTIQTSLLAVGTSTLNPAYTKLAKLDADLTEKQVKKEITSDEVICAKANEMLDAYYSIHQFQSSLSDRIPLLNLTGTATAEYSAAKASLGSSTAALDKSKEELVPLNAALVEAEKKQTAFTDTSNQAEITRLNDNVTDAKKQVDDKKVAITVADKKMHDDENKLHVAEQKLELTKNGVKIATEDVSRIVRERLEGLVTERIDTVGDYERGILFIGDAIKEEK